MDRLISSVMEVPAVRAVVKAAIKGGWALADVVSRGTDAANRNLLQRTTSATTPPPPEPETTTAAPVDPAAEPHVSASATAGATDSVPNESPPEGGTMSVPVSSRPANDIIEVDGIGPGVAKVLTANGIATLEQLADTDATQLTAILSAAGPHYRSMNPSTWPEQARSLMQSHREIAPDA